MLLLLLMYRNERFCYSFFKYSSGTIDLAEFSLMIRAQGHALDNIEMKQVVYPDAFTKKYGFFLNFFNLFNLYMSYAKNDKLKKS